MKKIEDVKILVVGDIMLDHYIHGDVERISPEAPVPVVHAYDDTFSLGGCGNVVRNIAELEVQVDCVTDFGHDEAGQFIANELVRLKCRYTNLLSSKITTQKIRIIGGETQTQMIRIDREDISPVKFGEYTNGNYDIIIVSDYGKGVITKELMNKLHTMNVPIIVDPKPENIQIYGKVFMITPNRKEWEVIRFYNPPAEYILLKKGKYGMELISNTGFPIIIIPAAPTPVKVFNVSGAGDTAVAIVAVCITMGFDVERAARIANECAGYVVTQPRTSIVPKELFMEIMGKYA